MQGPYLIHILSVPDPMAFPSILFKLPTDARNTLMKDRFNIEADNLLSRELDEMASLTQDTFDKGFDKGFDQGKEEGLFIAVSSLVNSGWSLDEALSLMEAPEDVKDSIRKRVSEQL